MKSFPGGLYEVEIGTNSQIAKTTTYYPAGGALRVVEGATNTLYYMLKDHLGSAGATLDANGDPAPNGEQCYA